MLPFRILFLWGAVLLLCACTQPVIEKTVTPIPLVIAIPTADSTPTPFALAPPASIPTPALSLPDGLHLIVTLDAVSAGWASDLDGRMHFGVADIHAGFYRGHRYVGGLQFDVSEAAVQGDLLYAGVELTVRDSTHLGSEGAWWLHLLAGDAIPEWSELTFAALLQTPAVVTFGPGVVAPQLVGQHSTLFVLPPEQLALLQPFLESGRLSFRLTGPDGGGDNLFTWDTGVRVDELAESAPRLHLVIHPDSAAMRIVTSTPTPENVLTLAAQVAQVTALATRAGTLTPTPTYWVTPLVVTATPTPANEASATFEAQAAEARRFVYGSETPTPANLWTATATATSTVTPTPSPEPPAANSSASGPSVDRPQPLLVPILGTLAAPLPTATATPTPNSVPALLLGKIAFYSDRTGNAELYVMDADGSGLARLTDSWFYEQAVKRDRLSADQRFRAFVRSAPNASGSAAAIFAYDDFYKSERQVSQFGQGIAYDPVWSPISEQIVLVSNDTGNDEVWTLNRDGTGLQQLTQDNFSWWDKHPSWSPDGRALVFWSNRSGQRQLWLMGADGSQPTRLPQPDANNWDPVWIKYPDPPYHFDE